MATANAMRDRDAIPFDQQTLPGLLNREAARDGARPLIRVGAVERTVLGTRDAAAGMAASLAREGVGAGDRVAVMSSNRVELLDLVLGCAWLGAAAVPVNTALRGKQLEHVLRSSGARLLAIEAQLLTYLDFLDEVPASLERIWLLDDEPPDHGTAGGIPVDRLPTPAGVVEAAAVRPGDTCVILYTSGTTGLSKGVRCPHAQIYWFARHTADHLEVSASDVLYTTLPMFHVNALLGWLEALLTGALCVVGERFSASRFWNECTATGATVTFLLGGMVSILARRPAAPSDRAHRVRAALAPAAPVPMHEQFRARFGVQLVEAYASTETNYVIGAPLSEQRAGYMGRLVDGFEGRVVDAEDVDVPDGTPGELVLRHTEPFSFATGYIGMDDKTVEAWRNLWFHTGDRVIREPGGWFRFHDRLKDAIRRRGENISSFEVEQALLSHPGVAAAAVYPVPSDLGEDDVMAAVVPTAGTTLDPPELVRHCVPRLAYFAIPRYIRVVDALPLTETGRVTKQPLRELGVTADSWDRESAGEGTTLHRSGQPR